MTDTLDVMQRWFTKLPHSAQIGLRFVETEGFFLTMAVDWRADLVGNPSTQTMHGGVMTSLVDTCSGLCVFTRLPEMEAVATLDLRIDHLKSAIPYETVYCRAECYRITTNIGFTRAVCYQHDIHDPIAHSVGTFMRTQTNLNLPLQDTGEQHA